MYCKNFGLTQDPFSIAPDPGFLWLSQRHREALAHLLYGLTQADGLVPAVGGGFVLLTGDIGTGKTTICRCFLRQIPAHCQVAYIFNPKLSVIELLASICEEFHITLPDALGANLSAKRYIDALNGFLLRCHADGQNCLLIIDEAQNLSPDVLEQLRLLTNLETDARKLLQIVLIGQPELRLMLAQPELEQLAQRVIARFHLGALDASETRQYIAHRLAVAGFNGALPFDDKALRRIHVHSGGVPRRINLLCGRALLGAWANGLRQVNAKVIERAAVEVFGAPIGTKVAPHWPSGWLIGTLALALLLYALYGLYVPLRTAPVQPSRAPSPAAPLATAPAPAQDAQSLLGQLPADSASAWRLLAQRWGLALPANEVCSTARQSAWRCVLTSDLTLPQLRQLDRAGIVRLQNAEHGVVYAVLLGLDDNCARLLVASVEHCVTPASLARVWQGDFATLWQPPVGYTSDMRSGSSNAALHTLVEQLDWLEHLPAATPQHAPQLDETLRARIAAFQRSQGLKADGQPGPMTFMQLERASAVARLKSATP